MSMTTAVPGKVNTFLLNHGQVNAMDMKR